MSITPERITELVDSLNHQFANPQDGYDWGGWFEAQPEADLDRTANAVPGELVLTDGSAIAYNPGGHKWFHVPADQYELPPIDDDEPAQS